MAVWLTRPVIIWPPKTGRGRDSRFDFYIKNAATAYQIAPPVFADLQGHVDLDHPDAETTAASAVRIALLDAPSGMKPVQFLDCRSTLAIDSPSPSYKLASKAGLDRVVPLALHGQGGAESIQALLLCLCDDGGACRLSVLSALHWPFAPADIPDPLYSSVAAAALITTVAPSTARLRLLGAAVTRYQCDKTVALPCAYAQALDRARIKSSGVRWAISHNGVDGLSEAVSACLPTLSLDFQRTTRIGTNFGCADILVSLNDTLMALPKGSPGVIFAAGRFNTLAALVAVPEG
jgi:hypothetical protein